MNLFASVGGPGAPPQVSAPQVSPPVLRLRQRSRIVYGATNFLAAIGLVGVAALLIAGFMDRREKAPGPVAAPKSEWIEFGKPVQIFALQTAEFGKEIRGYEARRHREGGGRQDVLTYGAEFGQGPGLRVSLYRPGAEPAPEAAFFVDLARQTARAGISVKRSAQPSELATRFGNFEVADMVLAHGDEEAACLGFRLQVGAPDLRISGFACGGARPLDRVALACALDRLDLISAGDDRDLSRFFLAAEQGRNKACFAPRGPGVKTTWLEHGANAPGPRNPTAATLVSR